MHGGSYPRVEPGIAPRTRPLRILQPTTPGVDSTRSGLLRRHRSIQGTSGGTMQRVIGGPLRTRIHASGSAAARMLVLELSLGGAAACAGRQSAPAHDDSSGAAGLTRGIAIADSLVIAALGTRIPGAVLLVAKDG